MAFFTTRVEFNGEALHTGMINGVEFKLPTGEFFCTSDAEIAVVANIAINIARIVWFDASVLVTKADGEPFSMGLKPVQAPAVEEAPVSQE